MELKFLYFTQSSKMSTLVVKCQQSSKISPILVGDNLCMCVVIPIATTKKTVQNITNISR